MPLDFQTLRERGMRKPVRVVHTICGHIVFFHDGIPRGRQGIIDPKKVILFNGAAPKDGDPIYCVGCGYKVQPHQLNWVLGNDD